MRPPSPSAVTTDTVFVAAGVLPPLRSVIVTSTLTLTGCPTRRGGAGGGGGGAGSPGAAGGAGGAGGAAGRGVVCVLGAAGVGCASADTAPAAASVSVMTNVRIFIVGLLHRRAERSQSAQRCRAVSGRAVRP